MLFELLFLIELTNVGGGRVGVEDFVVLGGWRLVGFRRKRRLADARIKCSQKTPESTYIGIEVHLNRLAHGGHDAGYQEREVASLVDIEYGGQGFLFFLAFPF